MGDPPAERRQHPRYAVRLECRLDQMTSRADLVISDLSLDGCFVNTTAPFPIGGSVRLFVTLNGVEVVLSGRVVHESGLGFGFGLRFGDLDPDARSQLDAFLLSLQSPR